MKYSEFDRMQEERFEKIREIGRTKGMKYTEHTGDRLANFKQEAEELRLPILQVWHVYFAKHYSAVKAFVNSGGADVGEELVENHLTDMMVYCLLLEGIVRDLRSNYTASDASREGATPDQAQTSRDSGGKEALCAGDKETSAEHDDTSGNQS